MLRYLSGVDALPNIGLSTVEFLSGRRITESNHDGNGSRLWDFFNNLHELAVSTRRATKARGYVTSVWVDCPGYILPEKYKKMCLPSLLDECCPTVRSEP